MGLRYHLGIGLCFGERHRPGDRVFAANRISLFALAEYLEELLDAPVDILTPAGIEGIRVPRVAKEIRDTVAYV